MNYLLLGNAPDQAEAVTCAAAVADVIVQINRCHYADILPRAQASYVFLVNTGEHTGAITEHLLSVRHMPVFYKATLMLARNPIYYGAKARLLQIRGRTYLASSHTPNRKWKPASRIWPTQTISFLSTVALELRLRKRGMPPSFQPSTGMIAYDWIRQRLMPHDRLVMEGFTFEGWEFHPWAIEKQLIRPIAEHGASA